MHAFRREEPRIEIEALCGELVDGQETSGLALDLSPTGLRLERPYAGGRTRRDVAIQIEVPGIDEVMWARADACFDILVPSKAPQAGPLGLIRRTGYRIALAARRDLRMLEEFVRETYRRRVAAERSSFEHELVLGPAGLPGLQARASA